MPHLADPRVRMGISNLLDVESDVEGEAEGASRLLPRALSLAPQHHNNMDSARSQPRRMNIRGARRRVNSAS
jgi:hypothetical protein